jgi:predicted HicB family RNase H-like nuclease
MERQSVMHIRVSEKVKHWLESAAKRNEMTMTALINKMIDERMHECAGNKKRFIER